MEKVTIERLKFSILVFFQVFILVAVSLWFVSMARTASAKGRSFGKLTSEKSQKVYHLFEQNYMNHTI